MTMHSLRMLWLSPIAAMWVVGAGCGDDDDDGVADSGPVADAASGSVADAAVDASKPLDPATLKELQEALWPMMGFDARNNYHNPEEDILNVDNADELEVKWTFEVAGFPPGTPVIAEGKVFVMATGGLYAINFATGEEVWSNPDIKGTASVAYHDGSLYVHAGPAEVYRLNAEDGEVEWGPVKSFDWPRADGTSSPIVANDKVYVGHSTTLEIVDEDMGQADARGGVRALQIEDGSDAWHYFTTELPENGAMVWSTVSVDDDAVYASTGNNYTIGGPNSDAIHAIADMDGSKLWVSQVREDDLWVLTDPALRGNPDTDFGANPILANIDGDPVVAAGDKAADFWVMDIEDGTILWRREDLSSGHSPSTGGVLNNGAFDGDAFYVVSNQPPAESVLVAMDAADGDDVWEPKTFPKLSWGMPSVANGLLVVPIDDEIHIFDAKSGEPIKMFTTGGTIAAGAVAIAGGRLVVGSGLQYPLNQMAKNNNQIICYGLP